MDIKMMMMMMMMIRDKVYSQSGRCRKIIVVFDKEKAILCIRSPEKGLQ